MCGFVGFFLKDTKKLEEERYECILKKMSQVIKNRGPNDEGVFVNKQNNLGLAFQRLSILDLNQSANQPMLSKNKNATWIFNRAIEFQYACVVGSSIFATLVGLIKLF